MSTSIDVLMAEHQKILELLTSFENLCTRMQMGEIFARSVMDQFISVFKGYADELHHGKEEKILFVRMAEHGLATDSGPLSVMNAEHNKGRELIQKIAAELPASGMLSPEQAVSIGLTGRQYITMLRLHIHKEDTVLYPMAMRIIRAEIVSKIDQDCAQFDTEHLAQKAAHEKQAAALIFEFEDAAPITQSEGCTGCSGCENHFCQSRSDWDETKD